jgi:hypothetical protein
MKRLVLPLVLLASMTACRSASITIEAGPEGAFETRLQVNDQEFVVTGKDGRLLIDGKDRGQIRQGDRVTVYSNGRVEVNGRTR